MNEPTIDECYFCGEETKGFYTGESDNTIFVCEDCHYNSE